MLISFETRTLAPNLKIPYIEKGEMAETPINFQLNPCTPNVGEDLIPSSLHPEPQIEPKLVAKIRSSYLQYISVGTHAFINGHEYHCVVIRMRC